VALDKKGSSGLGHSRAKHSIEGGLLEPYIRVSNSQDSFTRRKKKSTEDEIGKKIGWRGRADMPPPTTSGKILT